MDSVVLKKFLEDVDREIKEQGTTYFALSQKLSGNRSYFQRWKTGEVSPTLKSMQNVAQALGKRLEIGFITQC